MKISVIGSWTLACFVTIFGLVYAQIGVGNTNFRDLPCKRIELDEQWQYVGCHSGRMIEPKKGMGDYWLWACIDADTKLVFSHKVGKRDYWTGRTFVEDVRSRVKGDVQIATDNHRPYAFHIRGAFGYEGYSYGQETKIFGEPMLSDGTLARLGRNEGVRRLKTAERKAVVGSPDLGSLATSHIERAFLSVRQELKRFPAQGTWLQQGFGNAQSRSRAAFRHLQLCSH